MGCNQSKAPPNAEYFTEDPDLIETGVVQKKKMQNPQEVQDIDDNKVRKDEKKKCRYL